MQTKMSGTDAFRQLLESQRFSPGREEGCLEIWQSCDGLEQVTVMLDYDSRPQFAALNGSQALTFAELRQVLLWRCGNVRTDKTDSVGDSGSSHPLPPPVSEFAVSVGDTPTKDGPGPQVM